MNRRRRKKFCRSILGAGPSSVVAFGPLDDVSGWTENGARYVNDGGGSASNIIEIASGGPSAHEMRGELPLVIGKRYTLQVDIYKANALYRPAAWITVAYGAQLNQVWVNNFFTSPAIGYSGGCVSSSVVVSPENSDYLRVTLVFDSEYDGVNAVLTISLDDGSGVYSYVVGGGSESFIQVRRIYATRTA